MDKKNIDKANEIIRKIESNKRDIEELEKYTESGKTLYTHDMRYTCFGSFYNSIEFEDWEIRLMIHNKKQRITALEKQLEQL